ncbi:MAG: aminotransferase class V-fold PLP-dependent enzyme [Verrucomicrobiales bacterium]
MANLLDKVETDEGWRRGAFPACRDRIFLAHAAVAALPQVAVAAMDEFNRASSTGELDYSRVLLKQMDEVRESAARLVECDADEIALLGPTSLGLSLVANGLDWKPGDEVVTYLDDYPANVYPWKNLERLGAKVVYLEPEETGRITPELVRDTVTPRTKLFALASNHFLTGYQLDVEAVGEIAREHGILFCLDAIQTAGAFPTLAKHVDFLSADSHKWMLGPMTAGVVYVKRSRFDELRPSLLGAWNVKSPDFIARDAVDFEPGARRYEPGVLNAPGLLGMRASMDMLTGIGIENVAARLRHLGGVVRAGLDDLGFDLVGPRGGKEASGIVTFTDRRDPDRVGVLYRRLSEAGVVSSFRHDRKGVPYIRFSPHFYNTRAEIEQVLLTLGDSRA